MDIKNLDLSEISRKSRSQLRETMADNPAASQIVSRGIARHKTWSSPASKNILNKIITISSTSDNSSLRRQSVYAINSGSPRRRRESRFYKFESSFLESESQEFEPETPSRSIWKEFEEHIVSIDTDSVHFHTKPTTSKGSDTFKELLEEEYIRKNAFPKVAGVAVTVNKFKDSFTPVILQEAEINGEEDENVERPQSSSHAWNKVKIDIQEKHLENKLAEPTGGWTLLSNTVSHLTDLEKARKILYERYIEQPNKWLEGLQNYEKYKYIFEDVDGENNIKNKCHKTTGHMSGNLRGKLRRPESSFSVQMSKKRTHKMNARPKTAINVMS